MITDTEQKELWKKAVDMQVQLYLVLDEKYTSMNNLILFRERYADTLKAVVKTFISQGDVIPVSALDGMGEKVAMAIYSKDPETHIDADGEFYTVSWKECNGSEERKAIVKAQAAINAIKGEARKK